MKKQILQSGLILLLILSFTACKKQDEETKPLRAKMIGKWQVNKIEVTTYGAEGTGTTVSKTYAATDYMDFKDNESDDFELSLGTVRAGGRFTTSVDNSLFLDFSNKDLTGKVDVITANQLQFSGTLVDANPRVTETYYLSR